MAKKERKLTQAELKRKELFEAKEQELTQQRYKRRDLTISVLMANVMAIVVMLPVILLFICLNLAINKESTTFNSNIVNIIIFIVSMIALTVIHEGIHGITWAFFAKEHFRAIEFGIIWSMLTPYCTCKSELKKWHYIIGGMMPTIFVGIIPAIIAVTFNYPVLFFLSLIMIIGGGGDAVIILKLLFYKTTGEDSVYIDHPYECGVVVFERKD